jgi:hypothetical protein
MKHLGAAAETVAIITDAPGVFDVGLPFYVEVPESGPPTVGPNGKFPVFSSKRHYNSI